MSSNIVQVLRKYLAEHDDVREAFELAVKIALRMNVPQLNDPEINITDLDSYLDFYERFLNWVPVEKFDGKNVYYHILIFYFILDLTPLKNIQTAILPTSEPPYTWLSNWVIDFAKAIGSNMDKEGSLTPESLQTFHDSPAYRMQDYTERIPTDGWKTFNEFFAREINPGLRPIDFPNDDRVIVHPADSVFNGGWDIGSDSVIYLKYIPWGIEQLLDGSPYKDKFENGTFMHSFLGPNDYHRQHAPVSGTVVESRNIPGLCYLEVEATPDENGDLSLAARRGIPPTRSNRGLERISPSGSATLREDTISAPDSPGYQFIQARALIIIKSETIGLVAVLPIGMAQVSSVKLSVEVDDPVTKGQEISYFQFGGSDCVMIFQQKAKVKFTASLNAHYNFGQQIARALIPIPI